MSDMVFNGVLVAIKPHEKSGNVRFVVEVPHEMADEALKRAGGFLNPAESRHVAVAVLDLKEKSDGYDAETGEVRSEVVVEPFPHIF